LQTSLAGSAQALAWDMFIDAQSDSDDDDDYRDSRDSQRVKHRWEVKDLHFGYPSGWTPENKARFKARAYELGYRGMSILDGAVLCFVFSPWFRSFQILSLVMSIVREACLHVSMTLKYDNSLGTKLCVILFSFFSRYIWVFFSLWFCESIILFVVVALYPHSGGG
jgi:hypothetical protein